MPLWPELVREDFAANPGRRLRLLLLLYRTSRALVARREHAALPMRLVLGLVFLPVHLLYRHLCHSYGCYLPLSVTLGRRVAFRHGLYGIFISNGAIIGDRCIILHQVTIGSNRDIDPGSASPRIGSRVFIGAGAKIIGPVTVGDDCRIGANAIVVEDVPPGATAVSPKARIISAPDTATAIPPQSQ